MKQALSGREAKPIIKSMLANGERFSVKYDWQNGEYYQRDFPIPGGFFTCAGFG